MPAAGLLDHSIETNAECPGFAPLFSGAIEMWFKKFGAVALSFATLASGCQGPKGHMLQFDDSNVPINDYVDKTQEIKYPDVSHETPERVLITQQPRTVLEDRDDEPREITLQECVNAAISNNPIVRSAGSFLSTNNTLQNASSVYDPAIQETGVLFGGRGVEAALSAFDAQLNASMTWGRSERVQNNAILSGGGSVGAELQQDTGAWQSSIGKQFANGGSFSVFHNWNYNFNNLGGANQLFPSVFTGATGASYRQPLLAGAGTEFTRIAGPVGQSIGGLSGVTQGVLIARINNDLTLADFEIAIRNMLFDVENAYWDLYTAYRRYDTTVAAFKAAQQTWRESKIKLDIGTFKAADEAQSRDFFYESKANMLSALSQIHDAELRLRRLIGLPVNDGTILRPSDEPSAAELVPDWNGCLAEALTLRPELRKQLWQIKSLQLQHKAAKSLVRPRLDFVSSYAVNAFGDKLLSNDESQSNGYRSLTQNNQTGWQLGLEMNMPFGLRSAAAQVRNIELRLAKARETLSAQEAEVSYELASTIQSLAQQYTLAKANQERRRAAQTRYEKLQFELEEGSITPDPVVRAQSSLANAENAYYLSLVEYNKQLANLHLRKGTLLEKYNVILAEGEWNSDAQRDALTRAAERTRGRYSALLKSEPMEFAFDANPHSTAVPGAPNEQPPLPANPTDEANGLIMPNVPESDIESLPAADEIRGPEPTINDPVPPRGDGEAPRLRPAVTLAPLPVVSPASSAADEGESSEPPDSEQGRQVSSESAVSLIQQVAYEQEIHEDSWGVREEVRRSEPELPTISPTSKVPTSTRPREPRKLRLGSEKPARLLPPSD